MRALCPWFFAVSCCLATAFGVCTPALAQDGLRLDSAALDAQINRAFQLRVSAPDSAMVLARQAAGWATDAHNLAALSRSLSLQGVLLKNQGAYAEALKRYEEALEFAREAGDSVRLAKIYSNMGVVHKRSGDLELALQHTLTAVSILEHKDEPKVLATFYTNLAALYAILGYPYKAMAYYEKCWQQQEALGDAAGQVITSFNMGVTYLEAGNLEKAAQLFAQNLTLAQSLNDLAAQARVYNSLGALRIEQQRYPAAIDFLEQALALQVQLKNKAAQAVLHNNLAEAHKANGSLAAALPRYRTAIRLANEVGSRADEQQFLANLAEGFEALGQSDSALVYYHRQAALKDSLFSEAKNRQIVEMQEKFESVQKDRSIAELERKREQQAAKIQARNLLLGATGIIALVVLLLGVSYYQKLRAEKALAAKNEELNRNRMMELVKDNELKTLHAFMEGETAERQRIIGALHDGLGSRLATAKLHYDHVAAQGLSGDQHQQLELANGLLGETLVDLRELAHNLAAGVLNEFGLVPALRELSESVSATGQLAVQLDAFELEGRFPPALEISLYRSVQELLSNTIRHAQATETSIQLIRHEDHLSLLVSDNGNGFDPAAPRSSNGIGLTGISKRITALGGTFSIDSQPGYGVTAVLEVPLPDPLNTPDL